MAPKKGAAAADAATATDAPVAETTASAEVTAPSDGAATAEEGSEAPAKPGRKRKAKNPKDESAAEAPRRSTRIRDTTTSKSAPAPVEKKAAKGGRKRKAEAIAEDPAEEKAEEQAEAVPVAEPAVVEEATVKPSSKKVGYECAEVILEC